MKNKQMHSFEQMENETGQVNQSLYASPTFRCFYFAHMATYQKLVCPKFILHQFGLLPGKILSNRRIEWNATLGIPCISISFFQSSHFSVLQYITSVQLGKWYNQQLCT